MDFVTSRDSGNNLNTATPGYAGQSGDDFGAVIGQILAQRAQNAQPRVSQPSLGVEKAGPSRPQYQSPMYQQQQVPQMQAAPIPMTRGVQKSLPRYSYGFSGNSWAGSAPHLPTMSGYGREGEDFILEGGDVRALANTPIAGRQAPEASSPAMDPRMIALRYQQSQNNSQYSMPTGKK